MRNFFSVLFAFGLAHLAAAEITTNLSADGLHIISSNAQFGDGPEVVFHDDFEGGVINRVLGGGWSVGSSSGNQSPIYSGTQFVTGNKSGMSRFYGSNYNSSAELKTLPNMTSVYLSYYVKYHQLSGEPSRNIKLARLSAGYANGYQLCQGTTLFDKSADIIFYTPFEDQNANGATVWWSKVSANEWHRIESYLKLSSPAGMPNGISWLYADQRLIKELSNIVTQNYTSNIKWLTMPYYVAHDPGGDYEIYYDNVVVSKYPARVEFCEAGTYALCTAPVIPKVKSWSPSEIVVDATELGKGGRGNVYVFNRTGLPIQSRGINPDQHSADMKADLNR